MTNRKWVTCTFFVSSLTDQQQVSDIHFCERQSHHILYYGHQGVSCIAHFAVNGSLTTPFPMGNREWVTLHLLWKAVSSLFAYDQQGVSTLHILWNAVSLHLFLWPTASELHCIFVKNSLITSVPMTNSWWMALHILWMAVSWHCFHKTNSLWVTIEGAHCLKVVSWHLFLWPTASESAHPHFLKGSLMTSFLMTHTQFVCDIAHFVKGSLITFVPTWMTNSLWVILHILWKAVWSHLFLWPTACEWECRLWKTVWSHLFLWPTASEWCVLKGSLITSFLMTNSWWVMLHILWNAVSSHLFCDQQLVSDIAHSLKGSLVISFPMTNREWVTLLIL